MKNLILLSFIFLILAQSAEAKVVIRIKGEKRNQLYSGRNGLIPSPSPVMGKRDLEWEDMKVITAKTAKKYDIPPSVLVAMTALESGQGKSNFCVKRNNCWGIGAYDSNPDKAFKFESFQHGVEYLAKMLTKGRYSKAYAVRQDPVQMIKEIKKSGYASAPDYVQKVTSMPEWEIYNY